MTGLKEDLRYALRIMLRQRAFTLTAALVLALGIGFNSVVFSLIYAVLLRPLPYQDPERLHYLWARSPGALLRERDLWAAPDYKALVKQAKSFEGIAASRLYTSTVKIKGESSRVRARLVSPDYLPLLGLQPKLGRHFLPEESQLGRGNVVILTDAYWADQFGRDPSIVGRTFILDDEPHLVVGVLPALAGEYSSPDLYAALMFSPQEMAGRRYKTIELIGRLKNGVAPERAEAELRTIADALQVQEADSRRRFMPFLQPVHEYVVGDSRKPLSMLAIAVGALLLVACANLANLLLVRAASRIRELAVRIAMGASRWQIFRQMLIESVTLSLTGAAGGLLIAVWGLRVVTSMDFAIRRLDQATLDLPVVLFTVAVAILSGILFGAIPAWIALRLNLAEVLKDEGRGTSGGLSRSRGRAFLVMAEVAVSVVLLVSAGLLVRTFQQLGKADLGYTAKGVALTRVLLPAARYTDEASRLGYASRVLDGLRGLPGVQSASYGTVTPLMSLTWRAEIQSPSRSSSSEPTETAYYMTAGPGYFETIGARLKSGRFFTRQDTPQSERVVLISESLERLLYPAGDAVGQMLRGSVFKEDLTARVVGVVREIQFGSPDDPPSPMLYQPQTQAVWPYFTFVVKTSGDPASLSNGVRSVFLEVDPSLPPRGMETLEEMSDRLHANRRLALNLLLVFAGLAAALAAFGLYGVLAVAVAQRGREIGIRVSMGATKGDIVRMVLGQGLMLSLMGAAAGAIASPAAARILAGLLYGVTPVDPITYAAVIVCVIVISLLACAAPALRAAAVDPSKALRQE